MNKTSYTLTDKVLELYITSKNPNAYFFGADYILEKKIKNAWHIIPFTESTFFKQKMYSIYPKYNKKSELLYMKHVKSYFTEGEYRIVKTFNNGKKKKIAITLAISFSVRE